LPPYPAFTSGNVQRRSTVIVRDIEVNTLAKLVLDLCQVAELDGAEESADLVTGVVLRAPTRVLLVAATHAVIVMEVEVLHQTIAEINPAHGIAHGIEARRPHSKAHHVGNDDKLNSTIIYLFIYLFIYL